MLEQLAGALDAAHERGLVHRDVKPANVLITVHDGTEHAYLTDFGVAKRSETVAGLTAQGAVVGTVDYMAPEQITGGRTDARTDVYALACVFFQMLTGRVPYDRENSVAKLFAHVHEPPPQIGDELADLYPTFGAVIEKAMAKEPGDRYLSAGDFARDAAAALEGTRYTGPGTVVGIGEASRPSPPRRSPSPPEPAPAQPEPAPAAARARPRAARAGPGAARARPRRDAPAAGPPSAAQRPPPAEPPSPPRRRRGVLLGAGAAAVVAVIAVAVVALGGGGNRSHASSSNAASKPGGAGQRFLAVARPVPTNHVTGTGNATLRMSGNTVQVTLDTNGLLNGEPHAMHIHAGGQGVCPPAAAARPHDGHLSISTTDGIKYYGPPEAALTLRGDTSPKSIIDFARYPHVGDIRYTRTITVPPGVAAAIRGGDAVIVVHGIDYNGNGIYDNVLDRSELSNSLPGEATAPALCGPLAGGQTASAPGGSGGVYTASLHVYQEAVGDNVARRWLLCQVA